MQTSTNFGELLIEALEEAVAYRQGKLPDLRIDRFVIEEHRPESDTNSAHLGVSAEPG